MLAAFEQVHRLGSNPPWVPVVLAAHEKYLASIERMFAAVDVGRH